MSLWDPMGRYKRAIPWGCNGKLLSTIVYNREKEDPARLPTGYEDNPRRENESSRDNYAIYANCVYEIYIVPRWNPPAFLSVLIF